MSLRKQPATQRQASGRMLARAFLTLPGMVTLGMSLWLMAGSTLAEPMYHVARKIAPHKRTVAQNPVPQANPEVQPAPIAPAQPQLDTSGDADLKTDAESMLNTADNDAMPQTVPKALGDAVSQQENIKPALPQATVAPPLSAAPVSASITRTVNPNSELAPSQASVSVTPAGLPVETTQKKNKKRSPKKVDRRALAKEEQDGSDDEDEAKIPVQIKDTAKPAKKSHEKKPHPVVIAPEPLLPADDLTQLAHPQPDDTIWGLEKPAAVPVKAASTTGSSTKDELQPATNILAGSTSRPASKTNGLPLAHQEVFPSSTTAMTPHRNPSTSVRPARVAVQPAKAHKGKIHTMEPGFYPVGFTPAIRPVTPAKVQLMGKALSHYNRGVYYTQRQQWDAALNEYNQVLSLKSNIADAYVGLSTASLYKRDWENALKNSQKALHIKDGFMDPANITQARYNLSSVYCIANDYRKAMRYFKLVKKANHPEAEALRAFLEKNCQPNQP